MGPYILYTKVSPYIFYGALTFLYWGWDREKSGENARKKIFKTNMCLSEFGPHSDSDKIAEGCGEGGEIDIGSFRASNTPW